MLYDEGRLTYCLTYGNIWMPNASVVCLGVALLSPPVLTGHVVVYS